MAIMNMKGVARNREGEDARRSAAKKRWRSLIVSSIAMGATLMGAIAAFLQIRTDRANRYDTEATFRSYQQLRQQQDQLVMVQKQMASLMAQNDELKAFLAKGGVQRPENIADKQAIDETKRNIADLNQRIQSLENALLQTPEKALAVPLLKQQVLDS